MHRRTRDDEIAHAGKTGERLLAPAHALGQARDLTQRAGDEQRTGVVAHAAAVTDAAAQRRDVLERARKLHADDVVVRVDAEDLVHERALHGLGARLIGGRRHTARRQTARDLLGVRGAGEHCDTIALAAFLCDDLAHAQVRSALNALRERDEQRAFFQVRRSLMRNGAQCKRRRREDGHLRILEHR